MFANIRSNTFYAFQCRVKADPILAFNNLLVYELVDSAFPNSIIKKVNGNIAGEFRHIALDTTGNGYLYDMQSKKLSGNIGSCVYEKHEY